MQPTTTIGGYAQDETAREAIEKRDRIFVAVNDALKTPLPLGVLFARGRIAESDRVNAMRQPLKTNDEAQAPMVPTRPSTKAETGDLRKSNTTHTGLGDLLREALRV